VNIVILCGQLSSEPRRTELPSGTVLWSLDVSTPSPDGVRSVPVVWQGEMSVDRWTAGTEVVVAGHCRRRFFRAAGVTQSRTEVVAAAIVEVTRRRTATAAVRAAIRALGADEVAALRSVVAAT
jgi:single-strand DNA-binding protein